MHNCKKYITNFHQIEKYNNNDNLIISWCIFYVIWGLQVVKCWAFSMLSSPVTYQRFLLKSFICSPPCLCVHKPNYLSLGAIFSGWLWGCACGWWGQSIDQASNHIVHASCKLACHCLSCNCLVLMMFVFIFLFVLMPGNAWCLNMLDTCVWYAFLCLLFYFFGLYCLQKLRSLSVNQSILSLFYRC